MTIRATTTTATGILRVPPFPLYTHTYAKRERERIVLYILYTQPSPQSTQPSISLFNARQVTRHDKHDLSISTYLNYNRELRREKENKVCVECDGIICDQQ